MKQGWEKIAFKQVVLPFELVNDTARYLCSTPEKISGDPFVINQMYQIYQIGARVKVFMHIFAWWLLIQGILLLLFHKQLAALAEDQLQIRPGNNLNFYDIIFGCNLAIVIFLFYIIVRA